VFYLMQTPGGSQLKDGVLLMKKEPQISIVREVRAINKIWGAGKDVPECSTERGKRSGEKKKEE